MVVDGGVGERFVVRPDADLVGVILFQLKEELMGFWFNALVVNNRDAVVVVIGELQD